MLPRVSGDGLLARLRERAETHNLPVVVVSVKGLFWLVGVGGVGCVPRRGTE